MNNRQKIGLTIGGILAAGTATYLMATERTGPSPFYACEGGTALCDRRTDSASTDAHENPPIEAPGNAATADSTRVTAESSPTTEETSLPVDTAYVEGAWARGNCDAISQNNRAFEFLTSFAEEGDQYFSGPQGEGSWAISPEGKIQLIIGGRSDVFAVNPTDRDRMTISNGRSTIQLVRCERGHD